MITNTTSATSLGRTYAYLSMPNTNGESANPDAWRDLAEMAIRRVCELEQIASARDTEHPHQRQSGSGRMPTNWDDMPINPPPSVIALAQHLKEQYPAGRKAKPQ